MFWSKKKVEPAVGAVAIEEKPEPKKKEIQISPFGAQAHGLTRFGNTWINLSELSVLEFNPPDGCGAECYFKGQSGDWHFSDEDAAAMRQYLEGFESAQKAVDDATNHAE
jgi:hypothetical protein